jgi:hypothetical protein
MRTRILDPIAEAVSFIARERADLGGKKHATSALILLANEHRIAFQHIIFCLGRAERRLRFPFSPLCENLNHPSSVPAESIPGKRSRVRCFDWSVGCL